VQVSNKLNDGYRFGYNGQEKDNEVAGEGNHLAFGDYGYDTRIGKRWNVDPKVVLMPSWSPYTFCKNNPIIYLDPDGQFPILINGRVHKNSERASWTYWDKGVRETIKSATGYYHSQFKYVDGDKGNWAGPRLKAGIKQGTADAAGIYARMKETMKDGQITEQLQVISHSRGSAFGNGYMQGLTAEVQKLAAAEKVGFAYGANNIVEYSVNLAPHQSNSIDYINTGGANVNISHYGDPLSGNDATGNVINVHSNTDVPGPNQHGNAKYNKELDFTLQILEGGQGNVKGQLKEKYKEWDKTRNQGLKSKVD
jgi:RHS repeat-associated protein